MSSETYIHGNKIVYDEENDAYLYEDGEAFNEAITRSCPFCKKEVFEEGYDGCLGYLPGVKFACCGHGDKEFAYVVLNNGKELREDRATMFFEMLGIYDYDKR